MKTKITKRAVDVTKPGSRDIFLWDTEMPGFGCKISSKNRRVFVLQYWSNNRARRVTLGVYGAELTVDEARTKARRLRGQIAGGGDPAIELARSKEIPTLADFAERYLTEHAEPKRKAASYKADARNLRKHILPALGRDFPVSKNQSLKPFSGPTNCPGLLRGFWDVRGAGVPPCGRKV